MVAPVTASCSRPGDSADNELDRKSFERALEYMDLKAGTPLEDVAIDRVFIGSCTNGRIEDLRAAAQIAAGHKVSTHVNAMVVPGSQQVKAQAEKEGLDRIFTRGRIRLARAGLLHVPGHESRHSFAGRALRIDQQPQLRRPPGTRRTHAPGFAGDGRGSRHCRALRRHSQLADSRREEVTA